MKKIIFLPLCLLFLASCATDDNLRGPTQTAQKQEESSVYSQSNKVDSVDDYPLSEEVRDQYVGY